MPDTGYLWDGINFRKAFFDLGCLRFSGVNTKPCTARLTVISKVGGTIPAADISVFSG